MLGEERFSRCTLQKAALKVLKVTKHFLKMNKIDWLFKDSDEQWRFNKTGMFTSVLRNGAIASCKVMAVTLLLFLLVKSVGYVTDTANSKPPKNARSKILFQEKTGIKC